ncbi:MAG: XTP/dITP diphosphatase [Desulfobacteraceae bacterium]|uniref:dITP/XTP pyrophosphatase n=1 Tax=Candidatus Desulfacyla euxinica TaxID=2841693 RepID=A0A8J6T7Y7_9DELT|nr:XTP/dITP diphosphatase [Candidatus Desulfacyla euxinica]MBL6978926.1 XTP/dITP diphosphatase [Desulfobacteraceae bacterium]MBL7216689.1 XTP/dITP diphosphatase [Desulfobacteraceae bacterium]
MGEDLKLDRPLILATKNRGKVSEFQDLFRGFDFEIKSLNDFGPIPPVIEDGETFEDNSVKKAQFTAKVLGLPAIADDSGLTVKALGGKPGVLSARYAGEDATDEANNIKLLKAMKGIEQREAAFICVLAIAVPQGPALIYGGTCEGLITQEISGTQGFGYDPIFYYPPLNKTFAQMSGAEKNGVSHRGRAMAELKGELDKVLIWVRQRLAEEPF